METAVQEWLFKTPFADADHAPLWKLAAALEANQGDLWLSDFLNSPSSTNASGLLQKAVSSNYAGDPERGLKYASEARRAFVILHNIPGAAMSGFEVVFALQRQSKPRACEREAMDLIRYIRNRKYTWLSIQASLEYAMCAGITNNFDEALTRAQSIELQATQFHYSALALRALGLRASLFTASGRLGEAWQVNEDGLQSFWKAPYAPERGYQFYSDLGFAAEESDQWDVAVTLGREAISVLKESKHMDFKAATHFQLAKAEKMAGQPNLALEDFREADELFNQLPQDLTTKMYEVNVQISLGALEADSNALAAASRRLDEMGDITRFHNFIIQLGYWRARAAVARQKGDTREERTDLAQAISIGNKGFSTRHKEKDRWDWRREVGSLYRRRLELEINAPHDPAQALADWEYFRSSEVLGTLTAPITHNREAKTRLLRFTSGLRNASLIAFAAFEDVTKVWIADHRGIQEFSLRPRRLLLAKLTLFSKACADPDISLGQVMNYGRGAYEDLIAPFQAVLKPGRTLFFEADEFGGVPWAAMVTKDGNYFGSSHTIVNIPGLFLGRQKSSREKLGPSERALVVAPTSVTFHGQHFAPLPDTEDEIQAVQSAFPRSVPLQGEDANIAKVLHQLPNVSVFHFAGHALSREYGGELLLSGDNAEPISASVISELRLRQMKLAVLSACSTATAEGEAARDPNGLVRAFLAAGAGTVIASRWDADAKATEAFMQRFYGSLSHGDSIPTAVQKARDHVREQADWSHPYYWAVFEIFGIPNG